MNKENDSKSKLFKVIFGLVAAGVGAVLAYRAVKKEEKRLIKAEEAANKEIQELGVSPEKMKEEVTEHEEESERNFVKALYAVVSSENSGVDESFINLSEVCTEDAKLLHIMEDVMSGNRCLKLLIEVPEYTNNVGNFNKLRIKDIISACKDSGKYVMSQILGRSKDEDPAWSKMVAVMEYSYAVVGSDTRRVQLLEVPNWILKKVYDDTSDSDNKKNRAVRLYEDWSDPEKLKKLQEKVGNDFDQVIQKDAQRKSEAEGETLILDSIKGRCVELMYSLGFQEEDLFGKESDRCMITLAQANEIVEYYVNDFTIRRIGKKDDNPAAILDEFVVGGVIFHAPNKSGRFDSMARFYDTAKNGKIFIDSFVDVEEETKPEPEPEKEATPEQIHNLIDRFCGNQ